MRESVWPQAQESNRLIAHFASEDDNLVVIDTGDALMRGGEPNPDNYVFDGLHLSDQGYAIWTRMIKGQLLADIPALAAN